MFLFYVFRGKRNSLYATFSFVYSSFFSGYHTHKEQRRTYRGKNGRKEVLIDILLFFLSWLCNRKFSPPVEFFDDKGNKHNKAKKSVLIETSGDL